MSVRTSARSSIDADPGRYDMLALFLAEKHLDVVGITTTCGNSTVENTTLNARKCVELGKLTHIPSPRDRRVLLSTSRDTRLKSTAQRFHATGSFEPSDFGGHGKPKLAEHEAVVRELVEQTRSATLLELRRALLERGIQVGKSSVFRSAVAARNSDTSASTAWVKSARVPSRRTSICVAASRSKAPLILSRSFLAWPIVNFRRQPAGAAAWPSLRP